MSASVQVQKASNPSSLLKRAEETAQRDPLQSIELFTSFILTPSPAATPEELKNKEQAIIQAATIIREIGDADNLAQFVRVLQPAWTVFPRAKAAKLIRLLLDEMAVIPNSHVAQIKLCQEMLDWCERDKRAYLKQALEIRLAGLYLDARKYTESLALISSLIRELKRLDDRLALVEVQLLECKVYFALRNLAKSRASLTAAHTVANSVYCPPTLQAALDLQSGILHADDRDFKTAYSYFIETLDIYSGQFDHRAVRSLKYMLLCKIMLGLVDDLSAIISGKLAIQHTKNRDIEAMLSIGRAYKQRSLKDFELAMQQYSVELNQDPIIQTHLAALYDSLMQQNLLRIIEPYSRVDIAFIAESIGLSVQNVEFKLSQMILDRNLRGILDQGAGCLVLLDEPIVDRSYETALECFKQLDVAVEALYQKAARLA